MLVALAGLVLIVETVRHHDPAELSLIAVAVALVGVAAARMLPAFRASPANFPAPSASLSPTGADHTRAARFR